MSQEVTSPPTGRRETPPSVVVTLLQETSPPMAHDEEARRQVGDAQWRRAVIEFLDDGVLITDAEGLVLEMNAAFSELLGFAPEEEPYSPPYPWWPTGDEDAEALTSIEEMLREVEDGTLCVRELVFYGRDRERHWVRVSGTPVHHSVLGTTFLYVLHDVTRQREAQQRRSAAAAVSSDFTRVDDLADLIAVAEHGFALLFDGECTVQLGDGDGRRWFASGQSAADDLLPLPVRVGLGGEPSDDTSALRPGVLLEPPTPGVECRAWVQFRRPRRTGVDELIAADLLAAGFAAAVQRLSAEHEAQSRESNLLAAVESHRIIGQATGILVERDRMAPSVAFDRLRRASQRRNIKLRELAALVIETGLGPEEA